MVANALPWVAWVLAGGVALAACASGPPAPPARSLAERVTLSGTAADAKGGAVVVTDDGAVVYLEGVDAWPAGIRGHRVEVTGKRTRKKLIPDPVVSPTGERSAGAFGDQDVIEGATWQASP